MQNSEQSASSRHLLLDYEFIQGNFPAIVTTQPLTPHKLAAIQDPLINTEKLVGKEYFDTSALFTSARNKEKWRPDRSAATLALACKKSFRGHPKNVVKCESVTVESPLALAKTLSAKDFCNRCNENGYSQGSVISIENFHCHDECISEENEAGKEPSVLKKVFKNITTARKRSIDLTEETYLQRSILSDSSHVVYKSNADQTIAVSKDILPSKQVKHPKQSTVKLVSCTLSLTDRLIRKEDPQFYCDSYLGNRNVINVRWYNALQVNEKPVLHLMKKKDNQTV